MTEDEASTNNSPHDNAQNNKSEKISPIVIINEKLTPDTKSKIHQMIVKNRHDTILNYTRTTITVYPKIKKDHDTITIPLDKWKLHFHSYATKTEKLEKLVLKGLPPLEEKDSRYAGKAS